MNWHWGKQPDLHRLKRFRKGLGNRTTPSPLGEVKSSVTVPPADKPNQNPESKEVHVMYPLISLY